MNRSACLQLQVVGTVTDRAVAGWNDKRSHYEGHSMNYQLRTLQDTATAASWTLPSRAVNHLGSKMYQTVHFIQCGVSSLLIPVSHTTVSPSALWSSFSHNHRFVQHVPWFVWKQLNRGHVWRGRLKPACQTVGSVSLEFMSLGVWQWSSLEFTIVRLIDSDHTDYHSQQSNYP